MSEQGGYGYEGYQNWQPPPYGPRPTNALAVLALVFGFLFAPLGIVFGHIARSQIKRTGEEGDGLALAGLIIGYVFTGLGLLAVMAWIAFFGLLAGTFGNASHEASTRTYTYSAPASKTATAGTPAPRTTAPGTTPPRTTAVEPIPTVSGTDRQGFVGDGPSCNANNPAVAIAVTTGSRIVVCRTGVGRYYYKGERLSDGAGIELDDPTRTSGGFTATNGDVTYRLTSGGLVITRGGTELSREQAVEFWMN